MLFGLAAARARGAPRRACRSPGSSSRTRRWARPSRSRSCASGRAAPRARSSSSPGRPGDLVVTRRKGVASLRAEAHGVAAHAGNEPEKGRSAIWALARFVERAQALSDPARGRSVNVGTFHGGTSKNTVPEPRRLRAWTSAIETAEDGRALEAALEAPPRDAALPGTTHRAVARLAARAPLERTAASAALAAEYGACQRESGLGAGEAPLAGGGSDACTTAAVGRPVDRRARAARRAATTRRREEVDLASLVPEGAGAPAVPRAAALG